MKKILIHSIVFSPDGVSTAYLYNDIALKFKDIGYEVVVLTTTPNFNPLEDEIKKQPLERKCFGLYYVSQYQNVKVVHVWQRKYKKTIFRLLGFIYWHIMALFLGLKESKINVILSPSPPLTIGLVNLFISKFKKAKVIYNVQEIYPDLLIESKGLKSKLVINTLKKIESTVYNKSDAVTTIDQMFYNTIVDRFDDKSKLRIIPNFVDTDLYKPLNKDSLVIDRKYFPENNTIKLMYAGNIGLAQDWKIFLEVAKALKNNDVEFFVIGDGALKKELDKEIKNNSLEKLHLIPYQNRETIPSLIAYADMQFIFMTKETENHGFPSKVYTVLSCGSPLLVSSGKQTPIVNFLKDKDCACLITDDDLSVRVNKIVSFLRSVTREDLIKMGGNGREIAIGNYSKYVVTQKYSDLVEELLYKK